MTLTLNYPHIPLEALSKVHLNLLLVTCFQLLYGIKNKEHKVRKHKPCYPLGVTIQGRRRSVIKIEYTSYNEIEQGSPSYMPYHFISFSSI
jgi:hypothetical protein